MRITRVALGHSGPAAYRRHTFLLAAILFPLGASAGTLDLGADTSAQYTLTLGYAAAVRTEKPSDALINGPVDPATGLPTTANGDDGDRNFDRGSLINNRISLLGEFFLSRNNYGLVLRGDAFYDDVYHHSNDNDTPATVNKSGDHDEFSSQARKYDGGRARLLDAYAYGDWNLGSTRLNLRLGRQVVAWGESLFFSGVAASQGPADATKANVPGVEVKNILLPLNQAFVQWSLGRGLSFAGYYHFEYRPSELEPVGAYFSTTDVIGPGAEFLRAAVGFDVPRGRDLEPSDNGQYGLALKVQATLATSFGLYWLRYHNTNPELLLNIGEVAPGVFAPTSYNVTYFDGIDMAAASFSTRIGAASIAGEISLRDGVDMLVNTALGPTATRGQLSQALLSTIYTVSPNALSQQIDLVGEIGYVHVEDVDAISGSDQLTNDKGAWGWSGIATFNYRNVLPQWDLAVPVTLSGLNHTPAMAGAFGSLYGDDDMRASIATNFTYLQNLQLGLSYNAYLGSADAQTRPYADRDYAALNLKYSF